MSMKHAFLAGFIVIASVLNFGPIPGAASAPLASAPALSTIYSPTSPGWLDPAWSYRRPVAIGGSTAALTDYQVHITLDSSFDFSRALSDGRDLRVTAGDGTTALPFWIQSWDSAGHEASVWAKVPSIPTPGTTVYLYYGNPAATAAASGSATFDLFDEFEPVSAGAWADKQAMPMPKSDTTAAVYNGKLYVFGGYNNDASDARAETLEYDPATSAWIQKASMTTARWGMEAIEFNGKIYVFAGQLGTGAGTSVNEMYDPSADTWAAKAPVPAAIGVAGLMGVRYGDKIHLFYQHAHYEYDPATDTYTQKADVPTPRSYGTVATVGDKIYVIGGYSFGSPSGASSVNEVYDSASDTWSTGTPMPIAKYGMGRENPVINGKIYVTHGISSGFGTDNYVYDPATNSWDQKVSANHARNAVASGVINGKLYVVGGRNSTLSISGLTYNEEYDPTLDVTPIQTGAWAQKQSLPLPKADETAAAYNGKLYVFGGYNNTAGDPRNETFVYDPANNNWAQLASMPTPRWGPIAVEFNGKIYVFCGQYFGGTTVNEVYDPLTNTWDTTKANAPAGLGAQGLMGVRYGDKIHLFYQHAHYEYDPATDTYTQKADVPTPRTWSTVGVVGSKIYVIGGYSYGSPSGPSSVNEVYDPATDTWTTRTPLPIAKYGVTRENPVINGKIYVTHGLDDVVFHTDNYVYDPATDTWQVKSSAMHPRDGVASSVINNKLYVVGGRADFGGPYGVLYNEEYDPSLDTGSPTPTPVPWTLSDAGRVSVDPSARFTGNAGLLINDDVPGISEYAQHPITPGPAVAFDVDWNVTDALGQGSLQPQARIMLAPAITNGSLYYYRDTDGIARFKWYYSGFTTLQTGSWNTWYHITMIWNGANSKVIINGNQYTVPASGSADRVRLETSTTELTRQYFDNVRVRRYASPEPAAAVGTEEALGPAVIVGHVTWQGRRAQPDASQALPIAMTLKLGSSTFDYTGMTTDASGYFTVTADLAPGSYNWRVKNPRYLANSGTATFSRGSTTQVEMGMVHAGDANDDNVVGITDFGMLRSAFGTSQGQIDYDDRADFNGDLVVNSTDFNLLRNNYGSMGAPPLGPGRR